MEKKYACELVYRNEVQDFKLDSLLNDKWGREKD